MKARGYALPLVLLILLLLAAALGSLLHTVTGVSASSARTLQQRRAQLECQGLARVAASEMARVSALTTPTAAEVDDALRAVKNGAEADGITGVEIEATVRDTGRLNTIAAGALAGLPYVERVISTRLTVAGDDESCRALTQQPVSSFAITQFASFSTRFFAIDHQQMIARCDQPRVQTSVVPAVGTFPFPPLNEGIAFSAYDGFSDFGPGGACPGLRYAAASDRDPGEDVPLIEPFKPSYVTAFPHADMLDNPYLMRRQDWLAVRGGDVETVRNAQRRWPFLQADLRILNGTWYTAQGADSLDWPGREIWSDRFDRSTISRSGPRLYSWYERSNGDSELGEPAGRMLLANRGVVSYGSEFWGAQRARQLLCTSDAGLCVLRPGINGTLEPVTEMLARVTRIEMTRVHVFDQHAATVVRDIGQDAGHHRTPINIDLAALVTAFNTNLNGELGTHFCLRDGCAGRQFNGVLFVSHTEWEKGWLDDDHLMPPLTPGNMGSNILSPLARVPTPFVAPPATWSETASMEYGPDSMGAALVRSGAALGVTDEARPPTAMELFNWSPTGSGGYGYNALRLTNAADLTGFVDTGFTLITGLPVFIEGDFNVAVDAEGNRPAALIIAPVISVSQPGADRFFEFTGGAVAVLPGRDVAPRFRVHASLVTSTYQQNDGDAIAGDALELDGHVSFPTPGAMFSLNDNATIEVHGAAANIASWLRLPMPHPGPTHPRRARVEQFYPLELTSAPTRTRDDKRLPPATPRVTFVHGTVMVN